MRVLLVSHRFPPDAIAGVERYTQALSKALVGAGDTVSIVTRRPESAGTALRTVREQLADGSYLYRLTGGDNNRDRFLADHERLERLFERILIEAAPDVVHINHVIDLSPRLIDIARRHQTAVVLSLHDFYFACPRIILQKPSGELCIGPEGGRECARTCFAHEDQRGPLRWGLRTAYFRRLLSMSHRIICPSRYVASYFEQYGVDEARVRLVPNGIWVERMDPAIDGHRAPRKRGTLHLAFLGAVLPHKGLHVILDALRIARLGPVDLLVLGVIGDKQYARGVRRQAAALQGVRLRLYGEYEPGELPHLLQSVDCVVAPSQWPETFSIVTREALIQEIPVIVARLGALPEAVVEGENGFTFNHDCPQELAAILQRLATEESLLPRLREGARKTEVMTMAEHTDAVRAIYGEALGDVRDGGVARRGDVDEFLFLHRALLDHDFGPVK